MTEFPDFNPEDFDVEVIEFEEAADPRSFARRTALQALYEIDAAGHRPIDVIDSRLEAQEIHSEGADMVRQLVTGVLQHRERLDDVIQKYAPEWPMEQIAIVDRNVLRMAIYEFAIWKATPINVAISEAVELGRLFGSENTPRFVNGVLGTISVNEQAIRDSLSQPEAGTQEA